MLLSSCFWIQFWIWRYLKSLNYPWFFISSSSEWRLFQSISTVYLSIYRWYSLSLSQWVSLSVVQSPDPRDTKTVKIFFLNFSVKLNLLESPIVKHKSEISGRHKLNRKLTHLCILINPIYVFEIIFFSSWNLGLKRAIWTRYKSVEISLLWCYASYIQPYI